MLSAVPAEAMVSSPAVTVVEVEPQLITWFGFVVSEVSKSIKIFCASATEPFGGGEGPGEGDLDPDLSWAATVEVEELVFF